MQHASDGVGTDRWQPVGCPTQHALERGERPRAGAILAPIRLAVDFAQNPLGLSGPIPLPLPAAMAGRDPRQPGAVEPRHEVCDRIAALAPGGMRRVGEGLTGGNGKQGFGSRDAGGGLGPGATRACPTNGW